MFRALTLSALVFAAPAFAGNHKATPAAADVVTFTVRVENISQGEALKLANGQAAPFAVAPGLWVVHDGSATLFKAGKPDIGMGLEALAEDGNPTMLASALEGKKGVYGVGVYNTPVDASAPGPLTPGGAFEFTVTAPRGARLSLAEMFGQSNDLFYSAGTKGIELFDAKGNPVSGDVTSQIVLWDAGTEVNEEPGSGANQAPRQAAPNTGPAEHGTVKEISRVRDGFVYPKTTDVLRITIAPAK